MAADTHILLFFVDGLGLGSPNPDLNPIQPDICPHLYDLLTNHTKSIDATLGVPGLPQSATGQTALLTGINAAKEVGRHVEGFPPRRLKEIIREHSIFEQLKQRDLSSTFANAYYMDNLSDITERRRQSVTTVATLGAFGTVRMTADMMAGNAVTQDITREGLRSRGYEGPIITPAQAGSQLAGIAEQYAFTLFEYFQTDRAGHSGDLDHAEVVLTILDEFLGALLPLTEQKNILFLLSSDHGNIEDLSTVRHTLNPVPFTAKGRGANTLQEKIHSILDVTPAILSHLTFCV